MRRSTIRPMTKREYKEIPIDRIRVLNSRSRDRAKFEENIRSIDAVGLRKPIVVNAWSFKRTGFYELVCGEGRYLAFKALGREKIPAEVISCTKKEALLYSLVENIARIRPGTMWFAQEVKRMRDVGYSVAEIATITGRSESYIHAYIKLVEQGEERLLRGVEAGTFPITFAVLVAHSDTTDIQHIMMDAFDSGMVNTSNMGTVRRIVELRMKRGKMTPSAKGGDDRTGELTVKQLRSEIAKVTREKGAFVKEAEMRENRLLSLLDGLKTLWQDEELVALAEAHDLAAWPELKGTYNDQ